jgi:hypothetical protein
MSFIMGGNALVNLQATISAATAGQPDYEAVLPHHPITCTAGLFFDEEGELYCDHAKAPKGDKRTQSGLNHSMAILLLELASQL